MNLDLVEQKSVEFKTQVVADVPRTERDVYRIAKKEYRGLRYVDIRIYYRTVEDGDPCIHSIHGIWIEEPFLDDVIEGLERTKEAPFVPEPEGKKFHDIVISHIPVMEGECYRVTKGHGYAEVRRYLIDKEKRWRLHMRRGIAINDECLDGVIEVLKRARKGKSS